MSGNGNARRAGKLCDGHALTDNSTTRELYPVTLDGEPFDHKPRSGEIAGITKRVQAAGVSWLSLSELCDLIATGGTWLCAFFAPCSDRWGEFLGQRLFALDFDDCLISADEALRRALGLGLRVLLIYPTFNNTVERPRFRMVIDGEVVIEDEDTARVAVSWLLDQFPEADQKCRNPTRLWFGSPGEVYPLENVRPLGEGE